MKKKIIIGMIAARHVAGFIFWKKETRNWQ